MDNQTKTIAIPLELAQQILEALGAEIDLAETEAWGLDADEDLQELWGMYENLRATIREQTKTRNPAEAGL